MKITVYDCYIDAGVVTCRRCAIALALSEQVPLNRGHWYVHEGSLYATVPRGGKAVLFDWPADIVAWINHWDQWKGRHRYGAARVERPGAFAFELPDEVVERARRLAA